jgi:hypothetical protein
MAERAAHLVDHVWPDVPVRQWVLSLPHRLRYLLAWDHDLCRAVSGVAIRAVLGFLRRRARREGVADGRGGAVVVVQRFGGALNLHLHLHALVLDGVFTNDDGAVRFHAVPQLTREEVAQVVALIARRIARLLERRGLSGRAEDGETSDPWSERRRSWRLWRLRRSTGAWPWGRERVGASAGAATRRKTSRRLRWGPITRAPTGSICTPDSSFEPAAAIGWSGCAATRCARPWPRSGSTEPVTARSG